MTVLLVLLMFGFFLAIDYISTRRPVLKGTYTTPGFEYLGALAQDGGERIKNEPEKIS